MTTISDYVPKLPPTCYILTGEPSAGKSSIIKRIEELAKKIHPISMGIIEEAATAVIQAQQHNGIEEPWKLPDFQQMISEEQEKRAQKALHSSHQILFSDRCTIDTITYSLDVLKEIPSQHIVKMANEVVQSRFYSRKVFHIEPHGSITQTKVRHEDEAEAKRIGKALLENYKKLGFQVIDVPPGTSANEKENIQERVDFIFNEVMKDGHVFTIP